MSQERIASFLLEPTTRLFMAVVSIFLNCFALFYVKHSKNQFHSKSFYSKNKRSIGWVIGILSFIVLIHSLSVFYASSLTGDTIYNILEFLLVLYYLDFLLSDSAKHKQSNGSTYDKIKGYCMIFFQLFIIFTQFNTSYNLMKKLSKPKMASTNRQVANVRNSRNAYMATNFNNNLMQGM